ncbi:hypothetical protein [Yersinia ruckeri]|uniref:hypothetical protein n=1 Tax=Yersinia ruckeri TaxID=29486 RepID=UPI002238AEE3|nr:hypothetical protein [Yersinia ruckeri]MCW6638695.1 hypothetical protein [Yersinia ruckeri]
MLETKKMPHARITTTADVTDTLRQYLADLQSGRCWMSVWPLTERLLNRECEMQSVWENIARQALSRQQCYSLLEQIVLAGRFSRPEVITRQKDDYRQLELLNQDIITKAAELAKIMTEREVIMNRNAFTLDRTSHIVELMAMADDNEGLYRAYLHETLNNLTYRFEGKYWPALPGILHVIADESVDIGFSSESDREIILGRGKALPDYLRELFDGIENAGLGCWGLPDGFTLTDNSLATLATVTLEYTDVISADAVKVRRNEFSKKGTRGAWPFRAPSACDK